MTWTSTEDIYNRYAGDDYALPPAEKLSVMVEDAEDILIQAIPGLPERAEENEQIARRIARIVSGAVIRYANTGAEGVSTHQMTIGGASEMVSYSASRNRNSIFYTDEELNALRETKQEPRMALLDMYGGHRKGNPIIGWDGITAVYGTEYPYNTHLNDYYS